MNFSGPRFSAMASRMSREVETPNLSVTERVDSHSPSGSRMAGLVQRDAQLVENVAEMKIGQTVDHDAHAAFLGMLADQRDAAREIRIREARHGDQKMIRE